MGELCVADLEMSWCCLGFHLLDTVEESFTPVCYHDMLDLSTSDSGADDFCSLVLGQCPFKLIEANQNLFSH